MWPKCNSSVVWCRGNIYEPGIRQKEEEEVTAQQETEELEKKTDDGEETGGREISSFEKEGGDNEGTWEDMGGKKMTPQPQNGKLHLVKLQ